MTDDYCCCCYGSAKKAGRPVKKTDSAKYPICGLCEGRLRNGLVHYHPSNGTEMMYFLDQCESCRHHTDDLENPQPARLEPPYACCGWGVLDRLMLGMAMDSDHACFWYDPADLKPACPAECLRFTPDDYDFDDRDPPPVVPPGQMCFSDILTVPEREMAHD